MNAIQLKSQNIHQHTMINNLFIDRYMPAANGDYVKVYIYILRLLVCGSQNFTVEQIANQMNLIQSDVLRAIRYWSEQKLLEITYENDVITGIGFLSLEKSEELIPIKTEAIKQASPQRRPQYSMAEMTHYTEQDSFKELLYITERYMKKPLSQTDINVLLGFLDWLGLPIEVVEYLVEFCVSDGHRHMNYIEKVAMDWADHNIKTVEEAKAYTEKYNKNYYRIFKSLGINDHQPTPNQIKLMDRWINDYNFAIEVIEKACDKTIATINKPELAYVDTILTRWHNKGVKSINAIEEMDRSYKLSSLSKKNRPVPIRKNNFHNHNQRDYDYDDIEKKMKDLLKKKSNGVG